MIGALLKNRHEPLEYAIVLKEEPDIYRIISDNEAIEEFDIYKAQLYIISKKHGNYMHRMIYRKSRIELFSLYEVISLQGH